MDMLVLSYVKVLCVYPTLSSSQFRLKAQNLLDSYTVLLIYVNETIYLYGNLAFFKSYVNNFMAQDNSPGAKIISKCILWVRGLMPFSEFRDISFL